MILSMTGMSRHSISEEGYTINCECKSLNSKYLDLHIKLPRIASLCEELVRSLVKNKFRRGRVEIYFNIETSEKLRPIPRINHHVFKMYWNELNFLSKLIPNLKPPTLQDILSIPYIFDVPSVENSEEEEKLCRLISKVCEECLEKLLEMKRYEGRSLEAICQEHISTIEHLLEEIEDRKDSVVVALRDRMRDRITKLIADLSGTVDDHLILQEIAILADRTDITEELSRLRAHVVHFKSLAFSDVNIADGRQLDFLVQEMHREANTMGAKASDILISEFVVSLKTEIAKLREQVQNIE